MNDNLAKACEILSQLEPDILVPLETVKQCIALLESDSEHYQQHLTLLRSQIGLLGSDDTNLFSAPLIASKLKDALLAL